MTFFQEEKTCENDAEISNNFEIKQTKQKMIYQSKSNCNLSKRKKKLKKSKANTKSKNENSFFEKKIHEIWEQSSFALQTIFPFKLF